MAITFLSSDTVPYVSTFLFVFAVVFGLLTYAKIFKDKNDKADRKINAVISLAIALFSVAYQPLVAGLTLYMPIAIAVLIPLFFIIFVKKILEGHEQETDTFPMIVSLSLLLIIMLLFQDKIIAMMPSGIDGTSLLWIIGIVTVLMFFWLVYKSSAKAVK